MPGSVTAMSSQIAAAAVRIAVVGSINVDLVVRVDRRPAPGETVTGLGFDVFPGGKGANQAVAAARLGGSVRMVGRVGADAFAAVGLEQLAASGVATDGVVADGAHGTGIASIVVDAAGENSIVVVPGANGAWAEADVARAAAVASWAQVVSLQLEVPFEVTVRSPGLPARPGCWSCSTRRRPRPDRCPPACSPTWTS